jgi:diguanylate cyclase (GGDEF)-like protein
MASPVADGIGSLADRLLADITSVLVSEGSPELVLGSVADSLRELVPYDSLTIHRVATPRRLVLELVRGRSANTNQSDEPVAFGAGILGAVAESGTAELIDDVRADPRYDRAQSSANGPNGPNGATGWAASSPRAAIVVPLTARDELKGVLSIYRESGTARFEPAELTLASRFAGLAALAIDNSVIRARLADEVITDHLTGLNNHRYFHERLGEEMRRVHRTRLPLGLLIIDIDDFKETNDRLGHLEGDHVLQMISAVFREAIREEDVVSRIGGEEFGILLPITGPTDVALVAERLREAVQTRVFVEGEPVTVSIGVAGAPADGASPRELFASADAALRQAKKEGKNRVCQYAQPAVEVIAQGSPRALRSASPGLADEAMRQTGLGDAARAIAQLKGLHALVRRLHRITDVEQLAAALTSELRTLIDYHNCRVSMLQEDGETILLVAFRGDSSAYAGEPAEILRKPLGVGITGRVVASGESMYLRNARECDFAVHVPGTPHIDESILAVPLGSGAPSLGAIVVSKLGVDQFDEGDLLVLETIASHASVALENARLFQGEKQAGEVSRALFGLSQRLTRVMGVREVLNEILSAIPSLIPCSVVEAWMPDPGGDAYRLTAHHGYPTSEHARLDGMVVPAFIADAFIGSKQDPFVIPKELLTGGPAEFRRWEEHLDLLGAPMQWAPNGLGGFAIVAPDERYRFSERDVELARALTDIASLALANAHRFEELDRVYVSTIEALAGALEAQDRYTSDHAHALAEMAVDLGESLGLEEAQLRELELAALFHDIGKIGVPSEIIRKPGPLTPQERQIMNQHTIIGEQILAPVAFLDPIRPVVRACHERWDGRGYPDGLAGDAIPLAARIVFVCDAYHAMTTDRPYRRALSKSEAVRRLKRASGTQFDPTVVSAFLDLESAMASHRSA